MIGLWILAGVALLFGFVVFRGAPYVPSKRRDVSEAFTNLYAVSKNDFLVDIGSGDGVVLHEAAQRGAHCLGYELNPALVVISRFRLRNYSNISVKLADFWRETLPPQTTILYAFSESRDIKKIAKKLQREATRLQKPLLFMSYSFEIPGEVPIRKNAMMFLYEFRPLQSVQAQV